METTIARHLDCARCGKSTKHLIFYSDEPNCKVRHGLCIECLPPEQAEVVRTRLRELEMALDVPLYPAS